MTRLEICKSIASLDLQTLMYEPDVYALTQNHWDEGNRLYDLIQFKNTGHILQTLIDGPWNKEELSSFYHELLQTAELILDL